MEHILCYNLRKAGLNQVCNSSKEWLWIGEYCRYTTESIWSRLKKRLSEMWDLEKLEKESTILIVLRLKWETYTRCRYTDTLLASNTNSCLIDRSAIRLMLSSPSGWRQWDWRKEVVDLRNSASGMFIHCCNSHVFYMLLCTYCYWLLFMYHKVVTVVWLTCERTAVEWIQGEDDDDNSQVCRTGVNASSIRIKLYTT